MHVQISDRARTREWYERALGAEFLDRGPALNTLRLQLRLGSGEIHFTETPRPVAAYGEEGSSAPAARRA